MCKHHRKRILVSRLSLGIARGRARPQGKPLRLHAAPARLAHDACALVGATPQNWESSALGCAPDITERAACSVPHAARHVVGAIGLPGTLVGVVIEMAMLSGRPEERANKNEQQHKWVVAAQ